MFDWFVGIDGEFELFGELPDLRGGTFEIEREREEDGRWIAEVAALPGVLAYGATKAEAAARVQALALRVIADRLENGDPLPREIAGVFEAA